MTDDQKLLEKMSDLSFLLKGAIATKQSAAFDKAIYKFNECFSLLEKIEKSRREAEVLQKAKD